MTLGGARLPVPVDARQLAARLAAEERELLERLAALEARIRQFADVEQPAYASWRRLTFGPQLATLQELAEALRAKSILLARIDELERDGFHAREALFLVTHPEAWPTRSPGGGFDPDEVEARRRAKRERKRAERREQKRAQRAAARPVDDLGRDSPLGATTTTTGDRVVGLYRALARRIHPDSPHALRSLAPDRLGALWHDVQDAYESRSLERLVAISAWIDSLSEHDDDAEAGAGGADGAPSATSSATPGVSLARTPDALLTLAERNERLRALRRAFRARERELSSLRDDPAWDFERRRSEAASTLARQTRATIDDEIDRLRRALGELDDAIAAIGSPRRPREVRRR